MYTFDREAYEKRMAWYTSARFGMFIHWGLYAIPARGEWVRSDERIKKEDYMPYFYEFDPVDYNPRQWAKAAKEAGMKYAVLTAKHHEGFCLFDSQYTDFKSTNTKCGRDLVREFLEAFRAEGLRVGLYFSLLDWYHEDYPHYGDKHHPMRDDPAYSNEGRDFGRYVEYLHNQVRELCTNYGKLDLLWFDFSYENENAVMRGEAWRATELVNMVRQLQPDVIIDNRLEVSGEGFGSLWECNPTPYHGDFVSPEQIIPPAGIQDKQGRDMVWEACITMNNHWGYCAEDRFFKPAPMLIKKLVECVSKGGQPAVERGPRRQGQHPAPVPGDPGGDRRLDEAERREHLRLRQGRHGKAGQRPHHPQGQQALLPPVRELGGAHAPDGPAAGEGQPGPLSGHRRRGLPGGGLDQRQLPGRGVCQPGAGPRSARPGGHRAGDHPEGVIGREKEPCLCPGPKN